MEYYLQMFSKICEESMPGRKSQQEIRFIKEIKSAVDLILRSISELDENLF